MNIPPNSRQTSGVALVIVLSFLVLISVLVIGFFSSVSTELGASRNYAAGADTKLLADTAVQVVTAQIRQATAPLPKGMPIAWASQPGLIRVFGSANAAGSQPLAYYKLFSSEKMVVEQNFAGYAPDTDLADFAGKPEFYTDLNTPVLVEDPTGSITQGGLQYRADYPIFDPTAVGFVEGVGVGTGTAGLSKAPGAYAGSYPPGASYNPTTGPNPVPMPVKWLYVLRDGTMTAPTAASAGVSTFSGANAPTAKNPIVGRIAFWTDDETSKVNINTASEATFWDTPLVATTPEASNPYTGLGAFQPAKNEFQRYPGHPATTSLSPILGRAFGWNPPATFSAPIDPAAAAYKDFKETMYALIPRVGTGGSQLGTTPWDKVPLVVLDNDRLYASTDELLFNPTVAGGLRRLNGSKTKTLTGTILQQVKFSLTANSRAPELNLFGRPRISIWPIDNTTNKRTAKDNVFAFCSTIGDKTKPVGTGNYPFFFARADAKDQDADYANIPRNGALYQYLKDLTAQPVPGFGGSHFLAKYPSPITPNSASDRDQILTEIFDYIRCVNLSDTSALGGAPFTPLYQGAGSHFAGQVTPIRIGGTRGFGRFPTISEAVIVFSKEAGATGRMRAVLLLEAFCPSAGYMALKDTYSVKIEPTNLQIVHPAAAAPTNLFPASGTNIVSVDPFNGPLGRMMGGYEGYANSLLSAPGTIKTLNRTAAADTLSAYPFVSDWFTVAAADKVFTLKGGGSIKVSIYAGLKTQGVQPVQTLFLRFPADDKFLKIPTSTNEFAQRITNIPGNSDYVGTDAWLQGGDSIRSVEAKTDLRLIAGRSNVEDLPNTNFFFGPTGKTTRWDGNAANPAAIKSTVHSLRSSNGQRFSTAVPTGVLVTVANGNPKYRFEPMSASNDTPLGVGPNEGRMADLPEGLNGVKRLDGAPGDWDTGLSKTNDGPFINRADEGNSVVGSSGNPPYFQQGELKEVGGTLFSPNRMIASAGWFGSLPSGLQRNRPYETLLFRPDYTTPPHPGRANPPDHLLLDLFNMPVVEPYPISEPFSTAGKVNLNYQIVPFGGYMKRDTALRAVLRSEKMLCIPVIAPGAGHLENFNNDSADYRHQIDEDTTLAFLERRWQDTSNPENQVFRSASQICELDLYPKKNNSSDLGIPVATPQDGQGTSNMNAKWTTFWGQTYALTGDNARERPYARLYPRLTTKSNTFTVHLRVQSLVKPANSTTHNQWNETRDRVLGEYRGSAMIERYLDPADRRFDPTDSSVTASDRFNPDQDSLENAYRFRVLSTKQFAP